MSATSVSNVPPEAILEAVVELTRTKRAIDEATSAHRLAVKRHKNNGVPTREVLVTIAEARLEAEERHRRMRDAVRVNAIRYPNQIPTDLFANLDIAVTEKARHVSTVADAEQMGYVAGRGGKSGDDNPYPAGSELAQAWARSRSSGFDIYESNLGPGGAAANTSRKKPRVAKAALPMELPKTARKAKAVKAKAPAKRGRGRPKGSRNKPKLDNGPMPAHA